MSRLPTGIQGFDDLVQGGIPLGSSVVLQGPPGQEKIRFALTFLAEGLKAGSSGVLVISSQSPDSVLADLRTFGVDLDAVTAQGRLRIVDWYSWSEEPVTDVEERGLIVRCPVDLTNLGVALARAIAAIPGKGSPRAVIEMLSPATNVYEVTQVYAFAQSAKKKFDRFGFTSLVLLEKEMHSSAEITTLHQPFDGVIELERRREGDRIVRKIGVLHLKDTAPEPTFHILEVSKSGMRVVREASKIGPRTAAQAGTVLESQGERARRLHLIKQIAGERLKLNPRDSDALFAMAAAQATLDDARGGLQSLERLAELDPLYPGLWVLKTKLHARLGEAERARESRQKGQQAEAAEESSESATVPCPMCEALVAVDATTCGNCGVKFTPTQKLEDELEDLGHAAIQDMVQEEMEEGAPPPRKPAERKPAAPTSKPIPKKGLTNGLVLARSPRRPTGMTNGLRGRTNGRRGRTNGLTNGLGRTSGLTNGLGRTNGLTNGLGWTNGLTNGLGRTNGLTNGLGRTNGLTKGLGAIRPADFRSAGFRGMMQSAGWKLYVIPLVVVGLLLMPLFLVPDYNGPRTPIHIDGQFGDWATVSTLSMGSGGPSPNVDIVGFGMVENLGPYAFYVKVAGTALQGGGPSPGTMDSVRIFVDTDGDPSTGYRIDGIGADRLIEISGYGGTVRSSTLWEFDANRDVRDWAGWIKGTATPSAVSGSQIEAEAAWLPFAPTSSRRIATVHAASWAGDLDVGEFPVSLGVGSLSAVATPEVPTIITGNGVPLLRLSLTGHGPTVSVESLTVQIVGTAPVTAALSLRLVEGGSTLAEVAPAARDVTFAFPAVAIPDGSTVTLTVVGDFSGLSGDTIGLRLPPSHPFGIGAPVVGLREGPGARAVGYLESLPTNPRVDGGFAEWTSLSLDGVADVAPRANPSIDLNRHGAASSGGLFYLYADVTGRILQGTSVPEFPKPAPVQSPPAPADTDRDTVPDSIDPMPLDFNNDGISDASANGDYDGDSIIDYGFAGGTDFWLNTTLPGTFPPPYASTRVTVFIGPVDRPPALGDDVLRFFLDVDNSTSTGYAMGGIGSDRLVELRGKDGRVAQSALLAFAGSFPGEWAWAPLMPVTVATDSRAVELSVSLPVARLYVESGDFWGSVDSTASVRASALGLTSFKASAASKPLSVPWMQIGPLATGTLIDPGSNSATTVYNHQRKVVRAGDTPGTACDATNSDGCWYTVFYDQLMETATEGPSTETLTKGSKVSGTFPTDVQTSNNLYVQYREADLGTATPVDHDFVEQTTRQTTTSATYVDITGASLPSTDFTAGRKYLLVATAQIDSSSNTVNVFAQALHGSTAFPGSEFSVQTDTAASRFTYYWFVVWTAVSGEGVKLQFRSETAATTVGADQVTLFKLDIGALTENTDWFYQQDSTGDTLSGTTWDTLTSVTFTPSSASNWLVMTTARTDPDLTTVNYEGRIDRSGEAASTQPEQSWEGNDVTNDRYVQTVARVFSLGTASNTFSQQSRCDAACTAPRSYSATVALNLDKFEDAASAYTEPQLALSNTNFATQIQTASMTPTRAGDVWILGEAAFNVDATGQHHKVRLQVDNVDEPGTQTSDAYAQADAWDSTDEFVTAVQTVEALSAASHALDLDASQENVDNTWAQDRVLFAVALTLAPTGYEIEIRHDWSISGTASTYELRVEAYRSADEDVLVQVLTPPSTWNTRLTITKTTDDNLDQTYTLTSTEVNAGAPAVRFVGATEAGDSTKSDLWIDRVVVVATTLWDRILLMRSSDTSGSTWGAQVILASGRTGDSALLLARDSAEPSIAIDASGFLHIVWASASAAGNQGTLNLIRYTKTTVAYPTQAQVASGASWEAVTNVDDTAAGFMPSVSTDSSGNPHVAWSASKTSGNVYYTNKAGGTWKPTVTVGTAHTGLSVDISPANNFVSIVDVTPTSVGWWDISYAYRKRITITAGAAAVPTGYSVPVAFDHAGFVAAGKSLSSGNDIRVAYWTGSTWTELDRVLDAGSSWNAATSTIWFKSQAAIGTGSSDNNYFIYYGNGGALSPPSNKANVYLFDDDLEAGTLGKWTILSGLWTTATDQAHAGTYSMKYPVESASDKFIRANPALNQADVYMDAWWRFSGTTVNVAQTFRTTTDTQANYETSMEGAAGWDIAKRISLTWTELNPNAGTPTANTWTRIGIGIFGTGMRVFKDGAQINPASGSFNVGTELASGNIGFRKWDVPTGTAWWIDDVVVRRYVDPEPTLLLSAEETPAVDVHYKVCKDLSTSNCDASAEFTKSDGTAGFDVMATGAASDSYPSLATTYETNGDVWVAYAKDVDGSTRAIYARLRDYPSGGWGANETVDSSSGTLFTRPSIGVDKDNNLHALYVRTTGPQLYYRTRVGGAWGADSPPSTETITRGTRVAGGFPSDARFEDSAFIQYREATASSTKVGSFSVTLGGVGSTVPVTVGFQPKVVIFWWSGRTESTDSVSSTDHKRGFGVAVSPTDRRTVFSQADDGAAVAATDSGHRADAAIGAVTIAGAIDGLADLQSMDANGFTLVIDDQFATNLRVHYLALGGADLSDVVTNMFSEPGSAGTQDITTVGFQPDAVLLFSAMIGADPPGLAPDSSMMIGVAAGPTIANAVWAGSSNDGSDPSVARSYSFGGESIAMFNSTIAITDARASVTTWLSNGFRLNWAEVGGSRRVHYLALKGGNYLVGDLLTQTTLTTIQETGFGFTPAAVLVGGSAQAANAVDTPSTWDEYTMGSFTSPTERGAQGTAEQDAQTTENVGTMIEFDEVYVNQGTIGTISGLMDVQSVDADGFTLVMDDADPSQSFVWYLAFGGLAQVEVRYDWTGVPSASSHTLNVKGYRQDENILLQVLTPPSTWNTRITIASSSTALYSYVLTSGEFNSGAPSIRFVDVNGAEGAPSDFSIDMSLVAAGDARQLIDSLSDYPSLVVRGPNDATYGTALAGVYWKSTTSETYFYYIPEFEQVVPPILGVLSIVLFWARRSRRGKTAVDPKAPT